MDVPFKTFDQAPWIRDDMQVVIQERDARLDDLLGMGDDFFPDSDGYLENQSDWKKSHKDYMDQIVNKVKMRRKVFTISAHKHCRSESFTGFDMDAFLIIDATSEPEIMVGEDDTCPLPGDQIYVIDNIICKDNADSTCNVFCTWKSVHKWEIYQIEE